MADPPSFLQNLRNGDPAPPVDPDDLKRVWEIVRTVRGKLASPQSETRAASGLAPFGIDRDLLATHCSPGANVASVMFRYQFLQGFIQLGLLAPWVHGEHPDEFLFQVFATYPVHIGEFDNASLLQHIRESSRG